MRQASNQNEWRNAGGSRAGSRRWIAAAIVASALVPTSAWALPGDVNGNGAVTVSDCLCAIVTVLNPGNPPGCLGPGGVSDADVDCDSTVDISDVTLVIHFALGRPVPSELDVNPPNGLVDACEQVVSELVPEDYELVYQLAIPNGFVNWDTYAQIPYTVDDSALFVGESFDRIGYLLELEGGATPGTIFVSMDAFTDDPSTIGVPIDWGFQQAVSQMSVASDVVGIPSATLAAGGRMEFWSTCYSEGADGVYNAVDVPDANLASDCYGSMQLFLNGQTLFGFNSWSWNSVASNVSLDLGIGNSTQPGPPSFGATIHPDWTFRKNADAYTFKRLSVFVRPRPIGPGCLAILNSNPAATSGVYPIDVDGPGGDAPIDMYCDMVTDGGGWTQIMYNTEADAEGMDHDYAAVFSNVARGALGSGSYKHAADVLAAAALELRYTEPANPATLDSRVDAWAYDMACGLTPAAIANILTPGFQNQVPADVVCENLNTGTVSPRAKKLNYQGWTGCWAGPRLWIGSTTTNGEHHGDYCTDCVVTWKCGDTNSGVYSVPSNSAGNPGTSIGRVQGSVAFWLR